MILYGAVVTFLKQFTTYAGRIPWKQPTNTESIRLSEVERNKLEKSSQKSFVRDWFGNPKA